VDKTSLLINFITLTKVIITSSPQFSTIQISLTLFSVLTQSPILFQADLTILEQISNIYQPSVIPLVSIQYNTMEEIATFYQSFRDRLAVME